MTTEFIEDIATLKTIQLPAIPRSKETTKRASVAVPPLSFPKLYIVAPVKLDLSGYGLLGRAALTNFTMGYAVFNVETVPIPSFDAWLKAILMQAQIEECLVADPMRFADLSERWWIINELAERGVSLPLYDSQEKALKALKTRGEGKA